MTDDPRAAAFKQILTDQVLERALRDATGRQVFTQHVAVLRQHLVAALLKAAPPDEGPTWQPIETAPKDATGFLVYWPQSLVGGPEIDRLAGWQEYMDIIGYGEPPATHWMPLPTQPRDPAGKE